MRVLHVTNYVSPHQLPLARQLAARLGEGNFRLAATQPMDRELAIRGWKNNEPEPWILRPGEAPSHRPDYESWWDSADVVVCGERELTRMESRSMQGKLTFYMSERWWKPPLGILRLLHPRFARMAYRFHRLASSEHVHYLAMGGYAGSDMRRIASFHGRAWTWGYFTSLPEPLPACPPRSGPLQILWAGRMLDWKRVEDLVLAFALLAREAPDAQLTLIGHGPTRNGLERLAQQLGVGNRVKFHPSMEATEIRTRMREAHVYVLPSNAHEGWGAVLNEAMSEGAAVVASRGAGAALSLLRHGENGMLFNPGDYRCLGQELLQLHADDSLRLKLAKAGQRTLERDWSPQVGAERFLLVAEAFLDHRAPLVLEEGPMAPLR